MDLNKKGLKNDKSKELSHVIRQDLKVKKHDKDMEKCYQSKGIL